MTSWIPRDKLPALLQILEILDEHSITVAQLPRWLNAVSSLSSPPAETPSRDSTTTTSSFGSSYQSRVTSYASDISDYTEADAASTDLPPPPSPAPSQPLPQRPSRKVSNLAPFSIAGASRHVPLTTTPIPEECEEEGQSHAHSAKDTLRDNVSFCHNCDGASCRRYSDMRDHWDKQCETRGLYSCEQCSLLCMKQSDMRRHIKYARHLSWDNKMVLAPSKQAFGCPHCGEYFDIHKFPNQRPQYRTPTLRDCFLEHLLQHFKDESRTGHGDPSIRVRALLERAATMDSMTILFDQLHAAGIDHEFARWHDKDAIGFAQKLEYGLKESHVEECYSKYYITDLSAFATSLVRKCINTADFHTSHGRSFLERQASIRAGPQSKFSKPPDAEIRNKTTQLLDSQLPFTLRDEPAETYLAAVTAGDREQPYNRQGLTMDTLQSPTPLSSAEIASFQDMSAPFYDFRTMVSHEPYAYDLGHSVDRVFEAPEDHTHMDVSA